MTVFIYFFYLEKKYAWILKLSVKQTSEDVLQFPLKHFSVLSGRQLHMNLLPFTCGPGALTTRLPQPLEQGGLI